METKAPLQKDQLPFQNFLRSPLLPGAGCQQYYPSVSTAVLQADAFQGWRRGICTLRLLLVSRREPAVSPKLLAISWQVSAQASSFLAQQALGCSHAGSTGELLAAASERTQLTDTAKLGGAQKWVRHLAAQLIHDVCDKTDDGAGCWPLSIKESTQ